MADNDQKQHAGQPRFVNVGQLVKLLGTIGIDVTSATVRRWCQDEEIEATMFNGRWFVRETDLRKWWFDHFQADLPEIPAA